MWEERFMKLVEENGGFEFYQAYRDDVDHILGGKDGTYWYVIMKKGKATESYIGKYSGAWEDICVKGRMKHGSHAVRRNPLRMCTRTTIMCTVSATRDSTFPCSMG